MSGHGPDEQPSQAPFQIMLFVIVVMISSVCARYCLPKSHTLVLFLLGMCWFLIAHAISKENPNVAIDNGTLVHTDGDFTAPLGYVHEPGDFSGNWISDRVNDEFDLGIDHHDIDEHHHTYILSIKLKKKNQFHFLF